MKFELSKESSYILKGMAIIAIVMHNFCHFNGVIENEFTFSTSNLSEFWTNLSHGAIAALWTIISFLGHYGVEIFVFLSGYGLAKKYADGLPSFSVYFRHTIKKIWGLLTPGLLIFALISIAQGGTILHTAKQFLLTQLFLTHLHPDWLDNIAYGPYWYFGLAIELYLFYYVVGHRASSRSLLVGSALCLIVQYIVASIAGPESAILGQLRVNLFIALPVFSLGICLARHPLVLNSATWHTCGALTLALAVTLSIIPHPAAWLLSSLPWPPAAIWLSTFIPGVLRTTLLYLGQLSALLFVSHPIIRHLSLIITGSREVWTWTHLGIYCLATLIAAFTIRVILRTRYTFPPSLRA
ncbi:MAG: acyltransferase [Muribaculaceae bacterium]|nr:acyltransferase [Muribaculaceae bacterium]